ncbi:type II secretion system protein [Indioceanicola profundi]|uniref:type II secretion system protein n=1 Tax=Indioceanicola profundi TaxID=2220096 RepID=UPI000E6A9BB6
MWNRHHPARRPGFILLESLVALAILGISLGVLLPRVSLASRVSAQAPRTEAAVLAAEAALATVERQFPPEAFDRAVTTLDGETADGRPWRLEICCARPRPRGVPARLVDLTVQVAESPEPGARFVQIKTRRVILEEVTP